MNQELRRLTPRTSTIRRLLLRSGNECAFPECTHVIFNDNDVLVAECCHIEAALKGGERFNPLQSPEQRRAYDNLIFLCKKHHVETDNTDTYNVAALRRIKLDHEGRFRGRPFLVKPEYVGQVSDSIHQILDIVKDTAERVRRIDEHLLSALNNSIIGDEPMPGRQYFGCPEVIRFNGRNQELGRWHRDLDLSNTFLVGGISGIGKSTFIAKFVTENKQYNALWVDCEVIHTTALFYEFLAAYARQEFEDKEIASVLKGADELAINRTLLSFFRQHQCCIVFDGLNERLAEFEPLLKLFNGFLDHSKLIISSKYNIETRQWKNPVFKIVLAGLDPENFRILVNSYQELDVQAEQALQLHQLLNGHPYLVKLTASLLQYQPVDRFIDQLRKRKSVEVNDFIQEKALELLEPDELSLIQQVAAFQVPFRYSFGDFIRNDKFDQLFRSLKDKFLIGPFQKQFFIIPEFIRSHILIKVAAETKNIEHFCAFVQYLGSIKTDARIFEKNALVYHALNAQMNDFAREQAIKFLSALMGDGQFNLASNTAATMVTEGPMASWWFLYFIQGRVSRFLGNYEAALKNYDQSLKCDGNIDEMEILQFERASIFTLLAKETKDPVGLEEAKSIYEQLSNSADKSRAVQSEMTLATLQLHSGNYDDALSRLLAMTEKVGSAGILVNVQAGFWQILGDAYSQVKEYKSAFEAFDKSCYLYKMAIEKFGLNTIDGLYHLYDSYGWTFAKAGDFNGAAEMFACCVGLSERYDLGLKKGKALFDYGYHLFMNREFENAADAMSRYYQFIREQGLMEEADLPFTYGIMASAHWYSGDMINAVELMGLYILESVNSGRRPMVSLVEADGIMEEVDFVGSFSKRAYIFIIPRGKTFADFKEWATKVIVDNLYLEGPLSDFVLLTKEDS